MAMPPYVSSLGDDTIELSRSCGLILDPWQELVTRRGLGFREDGLFAAMEVGLNVARQNGKNAIVEARELAGLFLLGERMITHTAHLQDTSMEAMRRLLECIEEGGLEDQVKAVRRTNGQEGIELKTGQRIRFRTRTSGGGRGFSGDCVVFDEAMFLQQFFHGALFPIVSARPNPQFWYLGSAVDQEIHEHGLVFAKLRERGLSGTDPSMAWFEWSYDLEDPTQLDENDALSPEALQAANPALGIRIRQEYIENEFRALDLRSYAVERLGVGDWPATDQALETMIPYEQWAALADKNSALVDPICLAFDVSPDRRASIVAAGRNEEGFLHVELIQNRQGTGWLPKRLSELFDRHDIVEVVCDGFGPSSSIITAVEDAGVTVQPTTANELGRACGILVDAVEQKTLRHLGSQEIASAIRGSKPRPLGDMWAWSRKNSSTDISPLVAMTLALWSAAQLPESGGMEIY